MTDYPETTQSQMFECIGRGGALGVQKLNSATPLIQRQPRRLPMESMYYIGLDVPVGGHHH